jgi:Uma2 family endonuclease
MARSSKCPPQRDQHASSVTLVDYRLRDIFGKGFVVRIQSPMDFGDVSQPEPDLAIVRGEPRKITAHPRSAVLIVELSDTTLTYDRVKKSRLYASRGIPDYWIVNLVDWQLEIRRQPAADGKQPFGHGYASLTVLQPADVVSPLGRRGAKIKVADLLPG